jgi:hypothetical protein
MPQPIEDNTMGTVYSLEAQRRLLAERNALRDSARLRAHELRIEAMDGFIRDAGAWMGHAVDHGRRAADRLAARIRQHAKRRAAAQGSRAFEA